jgi:hypothetical protein
MIDRVPSIVAGQNPYDAAAAEILDRRSGVAVAPAPVSSTAVPPWRIAAASGGQHLAADGSDLGLGMDGTWWLHMLHLIVSIGSTQTLLVHK